jgi:hypothetical protein
VTSVVVPVLLGLAAAVAVAVCRVIRGWETWGDLIQMAAALGFFGGVLSAMDDTVVEGIIGGVAWGVFGTAIYWERRPAKPFPEPPRVEPRTAEQERVLRWLKRGIGAGVILLVLGAIGLGVLHIIEALSWVWVVVYWAVVLPLFLAMALLARRLRRTGLPFSELPRFRDKLPRRW